MSKGNSQLCCTWEEHDSRCAWKAQRRWGIGLARGSKVMSKGADGKTLCCLLNWSCGTEITELCSPSTHSADVVVTLHRKHFDPL